MGGRRVLALLLLLGALASLGEAYLQGDLRVALVLVFPVVYGSGPWMLLGVGLLVAAFVAWALMGPRAAGPPPSRGPPGRTAGDGEPEALGDEGGRSRVSGGGIVMLGPIPIVFGSDRRWVLGLMILALLLMAAWILGAWLAR